MLNKIERHLKTKIIPFWKKLNDDEYDGFFGSVDSMTLEIDKFAHKGLVQQARMLWSFSAMNNFFHSDEYLHYMNSAYRFLSKTLKDTTHHGYYWLSNYQGNIIDNRKITYGQGFVIYALSEYYKATQDSSAIEEAMTLFSLLEIQAKDPLTNAYWEEFDEKWQKTDCLVLGDGVFNTVYTLNTTLHILEAYTNLYDATKNDRVRHSVLSLLKFIKNHLYHPQTKSLYCYLDQQLQPVSPMVSYGHNIEAAWLIDAACEIINYHDDFIDTMTRDLVEEVHLDGFNNQYVYNHRINEIRDDSIIWWVQSEALTGFFNHFQKTRNLDYLHAVEQVWDTINQCLVDPRVEGEWFWSCSDYSKPNFDRGQAELWKTPYHNSRALMQMLERMKNDAYTSEVYRTSKPTETAPQTKK